MTDTTGSTIPQSITAHVQEAFALAAVSVDSSSAYVLIGTILTWGSSLLLTGIVGSAGALAHLKITQASVVGGTHSTLAEDTDFNSPNNAVWYTLPATNIHQTAGSGSFQVYIRSGAAEYKVYAKKASTTTTLTALMLAEGGMPVTAGGNLGTAGALNDRFWIILGMYFLFHNKNILA